MDNIIYVTGNIIAESGHHVAKSWVALADNSYKNKAFQIINGDLLLTNDSITLPYCVYAAKGGVSCTYGNLEWLGDVDFLYQTYIEEIDNIKKLANLDIPPQLLEEHLKCLSSGVFAAFELFNIELLSYLILSNKLRYESYKGSTNKDSTFSFYSKYESIHKITGHNLDSLREEFLKLNYKLPNCSKIGRHIKKRHDIVHRSGKKIMSNHLKSISFTKNNLYKLIDDCNDFVARLIEEVNKSKTKEYEEVQ